VIARNLYDAQRLVELLVELCKMGLPGLELATAIMIALGRGDEVRQIDCSRAGRHKALSGLRKKGLVVAMKRGWVVDEDWIPGFNEKVESIPETLRNDRNAIPQLEPAPAFDWLKLAKIEREWLHEVLREAAVVQCVDAFCVKTPVVRNYIDQIAKVGPRRCVLAYARLLKAYSAQSRAFLDQGLETCLEAALAPGNCFLPQIQDPVSVLREWLANSPLAEKLMMKALASAPNESVAPETSTDGTSPAVGSDGTEVPPSESAKS